MTVNDLHVGDLIVNTLKPEALNSPHMMLISSIGDTTIEYVVIIPGTNHLLYIKSTLSLFPLSCDIAWFDEWLSENYKKGNLIIYG